MKLNPKEDDESDLEELLKEKRRAETKYGEQIESEE